MTIDIEYEKKIRKLDKHLLAYGDQDVLQELYRFKQYAVARKYVTREHLDDAEKYYTSICPKNIGMVDYFMYDFLILHLPKSKEVEKE